MKKAIVLSPVSPYPSFSGNSSRVAQIVELLSDEGIEVHFVLCPIKAINSRLAVNYDLSSDFKGRYHLLKNNLTFSGSLQQRLLSKFRRYIPRAINIIHDFTFLDAYISNQTLIDFRNLVQQIEPDIVIAEYVLLSKLLEQVPKNTIKAIDTHDRFANRNKRIRKADGTGLWWSLTSGQEAKALSRSCFIIAIQKHEAEYFSQITQSQKNTTITLDIIKPSYKEISASHCTQTIGFVGSNNSHNEEGLLQFLNHHWTELIEKFPSLRLVVAGHKFDNPLLSRYNNVHYVGRVENLTEFYDECSILINPCLSGSGLKIKSIEALSHGKCLITTPQGAEGIEDANHNGMYIHPLNSKSFGERIELLLNTKELLDTQNNLAIEFINSKNEKSRFNLRESILNKLNRKVCETTD